MKQGHESSGKMKQEPYGRTGEPKAGGEAILGGSGQIPDSSKVPGIPPKLSFNGVALVPCRSHSTAEYSGSSDDMKSGGHKVLSGFMLHGWGSLRCLGNISLPKHMEPTVQELFQLLDMLTLFFLYL